MSFPDVILERYIAGDLSGDDRARIDAAIASDNALASRVARLREERAAFLRIDPPAQFAHRVATVVATRKPAPRSWRRWLTPVLATAVALLVGINVLRLYRQTAVTPGGELVAETPEETAKASPPEPIVVEAPGRWAQPPPAAEAQSPGGGALDSREKDRAHARAPRQADAKAKSVRSMDEAQGVGMGFGQSAGKAASNEGSKGASLREAAKYDAEREEGRRDSLVTKPAKREAKDEPKAAHDDMLASDEDVAQKKSAPKRRYSEPPSDAGGSSPRGAASAPPPTAAPATAAPAPSEEAPSTPMPEAKEPAAPGPASTARPAQRAFTASIETPHGRIAMSQDGPVKAKASPATIRVIVPEDGFVISLLVYDGTLRTLFSKPLPSGQHVLGSFKLLAGQRLYILQHKEPIDTPAWSKLLRANKSLPVRQLRLDVE